MDRKKATLGGAAVGVVAGVVGLAVLAAPAGAGPAPTLPATTPQALVQSVLTASPTAMAGTVSIDNDLGLPAIPGLPELQNGSSQLRVWSDGAGRSRLSVPTANSEQTVVDDGTTLYSWDSSTRTVTESPASRPGAGKNPDSGMPWSAPAAGHQARQAMPTDPASAAKELVGLLQSSSDITVDGTDTVAGQSAYDLVLTPKPNERTLLREVKIAIDATHHIPLQLTVLADNSSTPAVQIGFSSLNFGPQQASLFTFTPPPGATVTKHDGSGKGAGKPTRPVGQGAAQLRPKLVGTGWDTVLITSLPSGSTTTGSAGQGSGQPDGGQADGGLGDQTGGQAGGSVGDDPMALAKQFGTPVHGAWGSGWVISTNIGSALITSDGRIAVGLVPQQVLTEALGNGR